MSKFLGLLLMLSLLQACGDSPSPSNTAPVSQAPAAPAASPSPRTPFENDLQYIRNGGYAFIWIFSRKDGKPLDKDDAAFLRKNAPQVVDWVTTDEGRKVIGGTNFNLEEGNLELLKKRFVTEDYSGR